MEIYFCYTLFYLFLPLRKLIYIFLRQESKNKEQDESLLGQISEETVHASRSQAPDRLKRVVKAKEKYIEN